MNPWLEEHWPGFQLHLIVFLADAISTIAPEDLSVRPEEGKSITADGSEGATASAPMTERWIEIREATGRLITVIEILSPGNKCGRGLTDYLEKRRLLLESPINLVEIDLLLGGQPIFPEGWAKLPHLAATHYFISTKRAGTGLRREILRPLLREALPVIRIPLRKGEKDVFIDLQALVNQVHEVGRYHLLDYRRLPDLPLPADDQEWLRGQVLE